MSLTSQVQELKSEYKKAQQEAREATKQAEKLQQKLDKLQEQKEQQREYERGLKKAAENDLKNTFYKCFDRDGLEKGYINLSLKATRDEILKNVPESTQEAEYIDDNYEKILNKVKKIYENDLKAKNRLQELQTAQQQEKENKKIQLKNTILKTLSTIFKWTFGLLFVITFSIWKIIKEIADKS